MNYIKGKVRKIIFEANSGYKVGLIRIKETTDNELTESINKTITFTGYFATLTLDDTYIMYGNETYNDKYGYQYKVESYEHQEVVGKEAVLEFLSSPLVKGCGEITAKSIVNIFGEEALNKIKEDYHNLLEVPKMTETKALKIYESIIKYQTTDDMIISLKKYGFSINEALTIINKYGNDSVSLVKANPFALIEIIDFNKLDQVYLKIGNYDDLPRIKACFKETLKRLEISEGDTYFFVEELLDGLKKYFDILIDDKVLNDIIDDLILNNTIVKDNERIYLSETFDMEESIAKNLSTINSVPIKEVTIFETEVKKLQEKIKVTYNKEQLNAIKSSLENRVSIITGGPGTGKTTIIKAITELYIKINDLSLKDIANDIALLAPTGRAAKKMSDSTSLPASTIHRFLKWNKESNEFQVNELNKNNQKLIIVDETSMIDTFLFSSLLNGLNKKIQLVLVGDASQLPSVGPGLILNDLINSQMFAFNPLEHIYRQSSNSYIPILAKEIKTKTLSEDFTSQKDDYNFLNVDSNNIKEMVKKICEMSVKKGLTDKDIQILIPMYKGVAGIDNINTLLQSLFNPPSEDKREVKIGEVTYRVGDKVLQLVNDPDNSVCNGDIGYITNIISLSIPNKKEVIMITFDNNTVEYTKEAMISVKHAYAMTIHKSQGSEFSHVIMLISKNYYKMLYNKLLYTGVSRAKKSLILIGEPTSFIMGVNNDYSNNRKTSLTEKILNKI